MSLEEASRLLDAASCITIARQARSTARGYAYRLSLLVRRTDEGELRRLVKAFGIEGNILPISARGAPYYQLAWYGHSAIEVLAAAKPWLHERAREAKLAEKFWRAGQYEQAQRGPIADEVWAKRDELYAAMRELKAELSGRERTVSAYRDLSTL